MNIAKVDAATEYLVSVGQTVLQIHRFAGTTEAHVSRLLRWAEIPDGSLVIDLGSGVGEVARLMELENPSLDFTLVNVSQAQLNYSPEHMVSHCCSFLEVPEKSGTFDAALLCFAIGHELHEAALIEAGRLLRVGGTLFIYDMVRVSGSNESMKSVEYTVLQLGELEVLAKKNGFEVDFSLYPSDSSGYGKAILGDEFDVVFTGTIPAVWRLIKC